MKIWFLVIVVAITVYELLYGHIGLLSKPYITPAQLLETYDYIIVGAGSAGCVLANRLSQSGNVSILLVEAGEAPPYFTFVPGYYLMALQNTSFDWKFRTVPQKHSCKSLIDKQSAWPRGKCLGGSSSINGMQYNRGHKLDYDHWAKLGNKGWSYEDVLPYFAKSENMQIPKFKSEGRGNSGPLKVTLPNKTPFGDLVLEAAKGASFPIISDHNMDPEDGFAMVQQTVADGRRQSTFEVYLKPILNRPNLHVITNAHVTKVVTEGATVTGVQFVYNSRSLEGAHTVKATRDVILSAGSVGSPQVLMLSGIGPEQHLQQLGIPVIKNLPVGQNLKDHIMTDVTFLFNESIGLDPSIIRSNLGLLTNQIKYFLFKSGPLNSTTLEINANLHTGLSDDPRPDLQIVAIGIAAYCDHLPYTITNLMPEHALAAYETATYSPAATFVSILQHPRSVGEIRLRSSNPFDDPVIDPNYLSDPHDVEVMLAGIKIVLKLMSQDQFAAYNATFAERPIPGCVEHEFLSDDYFRCHIRHRTLTVYHPVSTCRMGTSEQDSVVDNELRVHGFSNLRVIDASAFPDHVAGNTNAPTIMLAEKAADILLKAVY